MADQTNTDIAALQADIKRLRADIAKIAGTTREGVTNGVAEAGETIQASGEKLWNETKRHARSVGREIEQNPMASAVAAFGAGMLLGVFLNGRRG
jgi:ElaB/YqjD/DUF883 family membrane-anchored ribosome-binding protein